MGWNGSKGKAQDMVPRFILAGRARPRWSHQKQLAKRGGAVGQHGELSAGVRSVASVPRWFGLKPCGFSACACDLVRVRVITVSHGTGLGCRYAEGSMSCTIVCRTGLEHACVHGNASATLGMLCGVAKSWQ
jgi:hypothetical protein